MSIGTSFIESVTFGINGNDENRNNGFTEIINDTLFDSSGIPYPQGVYDLRLGTTDHNNLCSTCYHGKKLCPGHRGYLTLKASVLQPIAISEIRQWLRIICLHCGRLMIDIDKLKKIPMNKRMLEASMGSEGKICNYCKTQHPKIKKDKEDRFTFWVTYQSEDTHDIDEFINENTKDTLVAKKLYPDTIKRIFERITESTIELLGKTSNNHPKKLILRTICIPPNPIRPGVKSFTGDGSSYHTSTNILQNIIKRNNSLLPNELPELIYNINSDQNFLEVHKELDRSLSNLQQCYYDLIYGSDSTSALQGNSGKRGLIIGNKPAQSFLRNLPRKEGRIRANLLGKRSFFTSRSTISGNVNYKIDELGLPIEFAKILQVEEYVQDYNIDWLTSIFLNGRSQYPGCSYIIRKSTGEVHDVSKLLDTYLEIGDILYRDVINGDSAYFNRMPTLERSSICVHKVIIIKDPSIHTFQINVLACELYNADFDGDQMHLWIARGIEQQVESIIMSSMSNWFISTKTSGTVNGEVQDSIVGAYELTRSRIELDKYHTMSLFAPLNISIRFDHYTKNHLFKGRDIISLLLTDIPINYEKRPKTYNDLYLPFINYDYDEKYLVIKNGNMLSGVLDSSTIGTKSKGGIFHLLGKEYGSQTAIDTIFALQQITLQFLLRKGFTVGTGDLLLSSNSIEQTSACVATTLLESSLITKRLVEGKIIPPIDSNVHEFYESLQKEALKLNDSEIFQWILSSINPDSNNFFKMILCGSKGGNPQLVSVMSAIGRSIINGKRMQELFAFKRTLPYCPRFATDAKSYGFVANSYVSGMTSTEFIFQDMASRYDLISKALTTATTGYFMRKGIMNNQSSITDNYRRVVKNNKIVQFIYGEDGLDAREVEDMSYHIVKLSDTELYKEIMPNNLNGLENELQLCYNQLKEDRDLYRQSYLTIEVSYLKSVFTNLVTLPVNVKRIINNVLINSNNKENNVITLEKLNKVKNLCDNIGYALYNDIQESKQAPIALHKKKAVMLQCMLIRSELNPRILESLTEEQVQFIIYTIRVKYANSLIDYGTAVGILAAQSISEPITQYMLDSHHRSVGTGTSKAGVIRINELYSSMNIDKEQSPAMLIPINPNIFINNKTNPVTLVQEIANSIEFLMFKQFVKDKKILLEPYQRLTYPPYIKDKVWIREYEASHPLIIVPNDLTTWCFRFVIDKMGLVLKSIDLELIIQKLKNKFPNTLIVFTPESSLEIVIRIWHRSNQKRFNNIEETYQDLMNAVLSTPLRGINKITQAKVEKLSTYVIGSDNAFKQEEQYVIHTFGTNLYNVLLHYSIFDTTSIRSNSLPDTYNIYGIEAARVKIITETKAIISDSKDVVNIRHLYIYADERTRTGRVTSIERGGLSAREHNNILLRASYQDPIKCITEAALNNTKSNVYGIAAYQLLGSVPKIGTLYNSIAIDEEYIQKNMESIDMIIDQL